MTPAPPWQPVARVIEAKAQDAASQGNRPDSRLTACELVIEVEDDGRGVAWDRIAERARAAGLPADSEADLTEALFTQGISSRDAVSELSGRGLGLAAAREACQARAGRVAVRTAAGRGTTFSFHFPAAEARRTLTPVGVDTVPRVDA